MSDSRITQVGCSRREFVQTAMAALAAGATTGTFSAPALAAAQPPAAGKLAWGLLVHLGLNMWADRPVEEWGGVPKEDLAFSTAAPKLRFDEPLWNEVVKRMADAGMNQVVIDLGEGVRYESHPEIAVEGSWPVAKLRDELAKLRALGIEPIPKMNFSTCHDAWLGTWSRQVSTPGYYKTCAELIDEVVGLFDKPRFFHMGYDEENFENQTKYEYAVIRQYELWWHDFEFFVKEIEKNGVRAWMWSDYYWKHPEDFLKRVPRSVLQANWYYGAELNPSDIPVKAYVDLDKAGFEQTPTGSNWSSPDNFRSTVKFCREHISPDHLKGFLQTPWKPMLPQCRDRQFQAIDQVAEMIKAKA